MSKAAGRNFRTDINGLRAWAVLAVVLFHFKIPGFDGGYVGVDIFFVISGFLMTDIITRALQKGAANEPGNFLWNFFLARGKRIWPALVVLCLALLVVGWFALSSAEFTAAGEQARSAVLFYSNIKFWKETGYFTANAHSIWLLHTWSLSVEWQFYMILPVAMLVVWKIWPTPRALLLLLVTGGLLSFGLCLYIAANKPETAFFLLPCRAWEMIAGGLVALTVVQPLRSAVLRQVLELAGLAMISLSILTFGNLAWPDWYALVPVTGTVLVLVAARGNSVWTDWTPLRWVGARSYSMYLWHWPLVVSLHYMEQQDNAMLRAACIGLTFLLGHLSYELVETRIRSPLDSMRRSASSMALLGACLLVVVPGTLVAKMQGFPARLPAAVNQMFMADSDRAPLPPDCSSSQHRDDALCSTNGADLGLVLIGDSHANALLHSVKQSLPDSAHRVLAYTKEGCGTMRDLHSYNPSFKCADFINFVLDHERQLPPSVPVLIINRSSLYTEGPNEETDGDTRIPHIFFNKRYATRSAEFYREVQQNMIDTACTIAARRPVFLMRPIPEMRVNVPSTLGRAMLIGREREISVSMDDYKQRHARVWEAQDAARAKCGVTILDPLPYLCQDGRCDAVVDKRPMYFDDDHLSLHGAAHLTPMFSTIFRSAALRHAAR